MLLPMKRFGLLVFPALLIIAGCGNTSDPANKLPEPQEKPVPAEVMTPDPNKIAVPAERLGSDKDLVCLMPVSLGISDTVTYDGKLYGFCASQCKEAFVKNPKAYLDN